MLRDVVVVKSDSNQLLISWIKKADDTRLGRIIRNQQIRCEEFLSPSTGENVSIFRYDPNVECKYPLRPLPKKKK